jgi:uncharacterized protein (TIGR00299 family) protein
MIAYFDCFSGISGDMTLSALLDLGVPLKWLEEELSAIPLAGFKIEVSTVYRSGVRAKRVSVVVDDPQPERNFGDIKSIIENSRLSDTVKSDSIGMFSRLADVEAGIHDRSPEEVHFHEVGGVDAMVDIIGTALGIQHLGVKEIMSSAVPVGSGFVNCQHGRLPVPVPATVALLKDAPVYGTDIEQELVTPTGATILASLARTFGPIPPMRIQAVGYGAGSRELESRPNLLRIMIGQAVTQDNQVANHADRDQIWIVEASIDDMNPEMFGFVMERLFADGALDVYWIPVYMKKNRPGTMVQVLCHPQHRAALVNRLLTETTTLGVRYYQAQRQLLAREKITVDSCFGNITVKRITEPTGNIRLVPEFEICKKIALEKDLPLRVVYDTIVRDLDPKRTLKS